MPAVTRVEPIDRDVKAIINEFLSPSARSAQFAELAQGLLDEADDNNRAVLGRVPPNKTFVNGPEGASLERIDPDHSVVVREYALITDLLVWIGTRLQQIAPSRSGRFRKSIGLFVDRVEVPIDNQIPFGNEYVFLSTEPYARKIERGQSRQAPSGIFEVTAAQASKQFGNVARIGFSFRTPIGSALVGGRTGDRSDNRTPAVIVTVR